MVRVVLDLRIRALCSALVLLLTLSWSPGVDAQVRSAAGEEEARALFVAGRSAFDQGRFEEALSHFSRSYELSGRPDLLFNVGTTADRLGRLEEAITAFQAFLEGSPDSSKRAQVEARLEILRQQLADQRALEARARSVPTPEEVARAANDGQPGPAGADLSNASSSRHHRRLVIGLVSASAVVVVAVVVLSVVLAGGESQPNYTVRGDSGNVILTLRGAQ